MEIENKDTENCKTGNVPMPMLASVLESIADGVYFTDKERRIIGWNKAAETITGWSKEDAVGKLCRDLFNHTDDKGNPLCDTICPLNAAMNEKSSVFAGEIFGKVSDGARKPLLVSCAPALSANGLDVGAVEVFRDLTAQKEIEKLKEDFLHSVTHDLKSPLTAVLGYTSIILENKDKLDKETVSYLDIITKSGEKLLKMINSLLLSARLETGKIPLNIDVFDLSEFFANEEETFKPIADEKGINLIFEIPDKIKVRADKEKISEVLENLISNAVKFTPHDGSINVSAVKKENKAHIIVKDTGKGIPADEIPKLFSKFAQAYGTTGGTGLGLYISRRILEEHGQSITVKSKRGEGTTFEFTLEAV